MGYLTILRMIQLIWKKSHISGYRAQNNEAIGDAQMTVLYSVVLTLMALLAGCGTPQFSADSDVMQEVTGTILWKPAYDGEDAWYIMHPPDTTSLPLPGAVVRLVRYSESAILTKNIAAETQTDEHGKYVLRAALGRYWITAFAPNRSTVIRGMYYPRFMVDFLINESREIEITRGEPCIHDFVIWELGTM